MRRMLIWLALTLAIGLFGGAGHANAAAFLWVAGANFSYAAAACATPGAAFYAWALFGGANSAAYAYTGCSGPVGASGSFAIAQAGIGGMGGAFVAGAADPFAGVGINTSLTDSAISGENYGSSYPGGELSGSDTGGTLPVVGTNVPGGTDQMLVFQDPGLTESTVCTDLGGGSNCGTAEPESGTSTGDITDLTTLENDLGLTNSNLLASLSDPSDQSYTDPAFSSPSYDGNPDDIIFIGEGDVVPEPATILLLGQALVGLGFLASRHRRRMG